MILLSTKSSRAFSAQQDHAGISEIILESAVSTICDNEDSVAAVDAEDKIICYRNWLGLMRGNLKTQFEKAGKLFERKLNPNRSYISKDGKGLKLHGRSLLLVRNVGHLMTNPSIILSNGDEVPEGIMDAFITSTAVEVIKASIIPSGTSSPLLKIIEGLVIKCPTFLTNKRLLPCNLSPLPSFEI